MRTWGRAQRKGASFRSQSVKTPACFLVDGYEPNVNTMYQFYGSHCHGHTCLKYRKISKR